MIEIKRINQVSFAVAYKIEAQITDVQKFTRSTQIENDGTFRVRKKGPPELLNIRQNAKFHTR
jgi:hypothetical protein